MSYAVPEIRTKEYLEALKKHKRIGFVSFIKDNSSLTYESVNVLLETAKSFRWTVAFAHVDSDLEDLSHILELFDLSAAQLPAIRLIKIKSDLIKYDNENEISADNLTHFVRLL
ncbi:hypothetical protein GJ496_001264 [Pomphorhynchus laevis]|nr:hypothetical protein GJ496_001264 [Pomphorhynchus laevis]